MKRVCFILSTLFLLVAHTGYAQSGKTLSASGLDIDVTLCEGKVAKADVWNDKFNDIDFNWNQDENTLEFVQASGTKTYQLEVYPESVLIYDVEQDSKFPASLRYENKMPVLRFKGDGSPCYEFVIRFDTVKENLEK